MARTLKQTALVRMAPELRLNGREIHGRESASEDIEELMSSILTNTSAMVALQTLRGVNNDLATTQNEIATGKTINTAKDNSAIWAISKVMESDVLGFMAISDSLNLGDSTISVARQASETISDLLTDMKGRIVAAQEENVDRTKIQDDIDALTDQINSIVETAQFNGLNLVKGSEDANILGSLARGADGQVTANEIRVARQDLTTTAGVFGSTGDLAPNVTISDAGADALSNAGNTAVLTLANNADYAAANGALGLTVGGVAMNFIAGDLTGDQDNAAGQVAARINALNIDGISASATGAAITITSTRAFETADVVIDSESGVTGQQVTELNGTGSLTNGVGVVNSINERAESLTFDSAAVVEEGDGYRVSFGGETYTYVAGPNENFEDVAKGLQAAIGGGSLEGISTRIEQDDTSGDFVLKIDNDSATTKTIVVAGTQEGEASGGLFGLETLNVETDTAAGNALNTIESLIDVAIDSAAAFGSVQGRIELQAEFVSNLTDAFKAGIGSLV
ncbi:MAG: flagellin, partial [Pseudomonadota bacterium]